MSRKKVILSVDLLMAAVVLMAAFLLVPSKTGVFIPIMLFSVISIAVQMLPMVFSSTGEVVFDIAEYILGGVYLLAQLTFSVFVVFAFTLNMMLVWTVCAIMLSLYIVGLIVLRSAALAETKRNKKEQQNHFYLQKLSVLLEESMRAAAGTELSGTIRNVFDSVKYSDPNSTEKLTEIETEILSRAEALVEQIQCNKLVEAKESCSIMANRIQQRNLMCKMYKC